MRVVITEFMDETALDAFDSAFDVVFEPTLADDRARLLGAVGAADALIVRTKTLVDQEFLDHCPNLRVIARLGVGLDNFDLEACARRGVPVKPTTGANAASVAEYAIAAALILTRGIFSMNDAMIAGDWPRKAMGGEVAGRILGIIGLGDIGRRVARRAHGLGMSIVAHDPYLAPHESAWEGVERLGVAEVISSADIVTVHTPLTDETRGMIDSGAIGAMKHGAVLINTARGGVVDEAAVAAALKSGKLAGAALDVFETEPLTARAAQVFEGAPNLILTPHIAGVTPASNARVSRAAVANVIETLRPIGA